MISPTILRVFALFDYQIFYHISGWTLHHAWWRIIEIWFSFSLNSVSASQFNSNFTYSQNVIKLFARFSNNFLQFFTCLQPLSMIFLANKTVLPWDLCRITTYILYISFHSSKVYIEFLKHLCTFFNESQCVFSRFPSIYFFFHFSFVNYIIVLLSIFSISLRKKISKKYLLRYITKCKKFIWYNSSLLFSTNTTPSTCFKEEIHL